MFLSSNMMNLLLTSNLSIVEPCPVLIVESKCKNDHGERTNRKLTNQPFYHKNRTGKMKKW